jgi:NADH dehydrogenase
LSAPKQIVVLGGGFAGLHLVRRLERRLHRGEAALTLVDRQNYHLFTPLLYQIATGELPPHAVAYPLRDATARAGYQFLQSEVTSIDLEHRRVGTVDGQLPYDHLVIVLGSVTNDYGIPGVRENALEVKVLADAETLKRHVLDIFESAATETDIARRREALTFVIVGAGPVGVELASSLRDLMDHTLRKIYPSIDFQADVAIHLIDGADRVLQAMDPRLSAIAMNWLERQRIRVLLNTLVSEISPGVVHTTEGARLRARTIVWSGGVKVNPLVASIDLPKSKDGRILVDDRFRAAGRGP